MQAAILTGRTLSGHNASQVWPAVAALFGLEADAFRTRILARSPIAILETTDKQQAHLLRMRLNDCGAEAELVPAGAEKWFLVLEGTARGQVPISFLQMEYESGRLPPETKIKRTDDASWGVLGNAFANVLATAPLNFLELPPVNASAEMPIGVQMTSPASIAPQIRPPPLPPRARPRPEYPGLSPEMSKEPPPLKRAEDVRAPTASKRQDFPQRALNYIDALVARVTTILASPRTEWLVVADEPVTARDIYTRYVAALAAIPPIANFINGSLIGQDSFGNHHQVPFGVGIPLMLAAYVLALVITYVMALIVDALASTFDGQKNQIQAIKCVAYSSTAIWISGALLIVPGVGWLAMLAGGIFSVFLLRLGLSPTMKSPKKRVDSYTAVSSLIALILSGIGFLIVSGAGSMMSDAVSGSSSRDSSEDSRTRNTPAPVNQSKSRMTMLFDTSIPNQQREIDARTFFIGEFSVQGDLGPTNLTINSNGTWSSTSCIMYGEVSERKFTPYLDGTWEVGEDRYSDTGKIYYLITFTDTKEGVLSGLRLFLDRDRGLGAISGNKPARVDAGHTSNCGY